MYGSCWQEEIQWPRVWEQWNSPNNPLNGNMLRKFYSNPNSTNSNESFFFFPQEKDFRMFLKMRKRLICHPGRHSKSCCKEVRSPPCRDLYQDTRRILLLPTYSAPCRLLGHHGRDPGCQPAAPEGSKPPWHPPDFPSSSPFLTRQHWAPTGLLVQGRLQPPSAVTSWIPARFVLQELMPVFLTQSVFGP